MRPAKLDAITCMYVRCSGERDHRKNSVIQLGLEPRTFRLLLNYWTHGGGEEASLLIGWRPQPTLAVISLCHGIHYLRWRSSAEGVAGPGGLAVQAHC